MMAIRNLYGGWSPQNDCLILLLDLKTGLVRDAGSECAADAADSADSII